ncbi:MAG: M30 family zinc metallopeptidase [Treponemataceae bacterium]
MKTYFIILVAIFFSIFGCANNASVSEPKLINIELDSNYIGATAYLVKTNKTDKKVVAQSSGKITTQNIVLNQSTITKNEQNKNVPFTRIDVQKYKLPEITPENMVKNTQKNISFNYKNPVVDDKKDFFIFVNPSSDEGETIKKEAVLGATNDTVNVWVIDNGVPRSKAQEIMEKFNKIYGYTRILLGEESNIFYDTKESLDDEKINIIVYNMEGNTPTSGVLGFFFSADYQKNYYVSNKGKYFYIDAAFSIKYPQDVYSTLIHEFAHMINFSEKVIKNGEAFQTWFTEMLAMTAEDVIQNIEDVGIGLSASPRIGRVTSFKLIEADTGLTEWKTSSTAETHLSYANAYMLGAFFARNYGGFNLIKEIATNNKDGEQAISQALLKLGETDDFVAAINKFPEAVLHLKASTETGKKSFNNKVSSMVGNTNYAFEAINLIKIPTTRLTLKQEDVPRYSYTIQKLGVVSDGSTITIENPHVNLDYKIEYIFD